MGCVYQSLAGPGTPPMGSGRFTPCPCRFPLVSTVRPEAKLSKRNVRNVAAVLLPLQIQKLFVNIVRLNK